MFVLRQNSPPYPAECRPTRQPTGNPGKAYKLANKLAAKWKWNRYCITPSRAVVITLILSSVLGLFAQGLCFCRTGHGDTHVVNLFRSEGIDPCMPPPPPPVLSSAPGRAFSVSTVLPHQVDSASLNVKGKKTVAPHPSPPRIKH